MEKVNEIAGVDDSSPVGQEYRGSMPGRVTDPTGAVIPAAQVTVTNTATTEQSAPRRVYWSARVKF
ncbi:MAG TPA: carboxypeptidase-like regulatory domain-containing protein [Bryobacteraceae bacterium]|nr:carboxypeptidase-like regulatory domain-containing protein [Bryobacteraceae bacterium]